MHVGSNNAVEVFVNSGASVSGAMSLNSSKSDYIFGGWYVGPFTWIHDDVVEGGCLCVDGKGPLTLRQRLLSIQARTRAARGMWT
jgi:hypothetical protein